MFEVLMEERLLLQNIHLSQLLPQILDEASFLALDGHLLGKGVHLKGAKKLKKFIDDEIIPTHMQRPPKMLFVILVKENPALPHNIQNSFMSNGVSGTEAFLAPLDGCPGAIPCIGFWHL